MRSEFFDQLHFEDNNLAEHIIAIHKKVTLEKATDEELICELLIRFGEDPTREGLKETPTRYIKFMSQFLNVPKFNMTSFKNDGYDEMVIQKNIPFHSLCEHHLAVIEGMANVAYIPNDRYVGLSKLARTVDLFSHKLQNQERITQQVSEFLMNELKPKGVAVSLTARHYCIEMRGVKKHNTWTTTNSLSGCFRTDPACRAEFLASINNK